MTTSGTHIAYFHTCQRKLWLFSNHIRMEHSSQIVAEGKLIGETTYQDRAEKYTELQVGNIKIDYYDAKNKIIHEVKKSDKAEFAHIAQVKYYMYVLRQHGIEGVTAILEYPKMRQKQVVEWEDEDEREVSGWVKDIHKLLSEDTCPGLTKKPICRKCSYYDFCYVEEQGA